MIIETREQFEEIMLEAEFAQDGELSALRKGHLEDTFKALREVARAAKHLAARGYGEPNKSWQKNTLDKLDALSGWLTEANHQ